MSQVVEARDKLLPLNMRVESRKRALIDRAVAELGGDRTSFVLDAACRRAEQVLLERQVFMLDDQSFEAFERALETPIEDNQCVRNLLSRKKRWT
ncbi:DUF1778 domain-containing protein [Halomonas desiderata]|uniref:type II toxin-antitoxin system TacA family antitoxin n=1 Tax=Billgrantia desiderata TaxID=52021 RepID=UPI00174C16CD|nr:DUF1778 domain-containing protein [Halomonas desiderata]